MHFKKRTTRNKEIFDFFDCFGRRKTHDRPRAHIRYAEKNIINYHGVKDIKEPELVKDHTLKRRDKFNSFFKILIFIYIVLIFSLTLLLRFAPFVDRAV